MNEFKFKLPPRPTKDEHYDEWLELLNRAPAGVGNEWRKAVLHALVDMYTPQREG